MSRSLTLLLPDSDALDRLMMAPLSQALSFFLGLALGSLLCLDRNHVCGLEDPIWGWFPA